MSINSLTIKQIIQEEFNSLGYNYISQEIKSFSQNDFKKLKKFTLTYSKNVDKAKENTINKIQNLIKRKINLHLDDINPNCLSNCYLSHSGNLSHIFHSYNYKDKFNYVKHSYSNFDKSSDWFLNKTTNFRNNTLTSPKETKLRMSTSSISRNFLNQQFFKSKSAKKILKNISSNLRKKEEQSKKENITFISSLAQDIICFIDDMKTLQNSICNKESNVIQLKKIFEKKKKALYDKAKNIIQKQENKKSENFPLTNDISSISHPFTGINSPKFTKLTNSSPNNVSNVNFNLNSNEETKVLKDSIVELKTLIEDLKSGSKVITEELRTEIQTLTNKTTTQSENIKGYEKTIINNLESIKSIYKLLKDYNSVNDTMPIQTSLSLESKFEWYENEIKKIISFISANKSINIPEFETKKSKTANMIGESKKIADVIKETSISIIEMIKPYIKELESNIDLTIFDSKNNFEEGEIISSIKKLKQYIKYIIDLIDEMKKINNLLKKQLKESKQKNEIFKTSLANAMTKKGDKNIKKSESNFNIRDLESEKVAVHKLNTDLLNIQRDLLQKLEFKDLETEKNQETINSLLQINNKTKNINFDNVDIQTNYISIEKYSCLLNLYLNELDKSKMLKNEYFHLIEELGDYIQNGNKIKVDFSIISKKGYDNDKKIKELNVEEELDSNELGTISQDDLLSDKDRNFNKNSKESKSNICNNIENYANSNNTQNDKIKMQNLKMELKKNTSELEKVTKKLNEALDIISTIGNTIIKLINEIHITSQIKEYLILIFRLLKYSERDINKLFAEREKHRKLNYKKP